jgi:FemAB-related protein (PEP-CTERM system-associated)
MNAPLRLDPVGTPGPLALVSDVGDAELAAFLAATPDSTPFHSAAWGRAIESATGHRWHILAARDEAGALVGILPLHHIRSRLFGSTLASTGFAVDGGILTSDPRAVSLLAQAAIDLARNLGAPGVDLRGGVIASPNRAHPEPVEGCQSHACQEGGFDKLSLSANASWSIDDTTYLGFTRPLAASRDDELAAIPRKHRAEVRKALANDLSVTIGTSRADRDAHFTAYATSVRNLGTPVFPRKLFNAVLDAFGDDADILTIHSDGAVVASVLSLYWQGRVMPYWGGGTAAARGLRANERMYFELMDHARTRGCMTFDFGRSKAGSGPAAYKKNWGFEPAPLAYSRWTADGTPPRNTNPTSAKYRLMVDTWQKLPLWLANRLGPMISRQLG